MCSTLLQELSYPDFCETLVRLAQHTFSAVARLDMRLSALITQHLQPLLEPRPPYHALASWMALPASGQYVASIDPVLRLVFAAAARHVKAPALLNHGVASSYVSQACASGRTTDAGVYMSPDLSGIGNLIKGTPDDRETHPLDSVVKDEVDFCMLTVRQLVLLLQQTGIIVTDDSTKSAKGISAHVALQAIRKSCFPVSTPPPVRSLHDMFEQRGARGTVFVHFSGFEPIDLQYQRTTFAGRGRAGALSAIHSG